MRSKTVLSITLVGTQRMRYAPTSGQISKISLITCMERIF